MPGVILAFPPRLSEAESKIYAYLNQLMGACVEVAEQPQPEMVDTLADLLVKASRTLRELTKEMVRERRHRQAQ